MAKQNEAEAVKSWAGRLTAFQSWRDKAIDAKENQLFLDYYESRFYQYDSNDPRAGIPLIFTYVDVIMSALDRAFPQIEILRRADPRYTQVLNAAEAVLDYEQRECNYRRQFRKALLYGLLQDYCGWVKVGYSAEFGLNEEAQGGRDGHREGTKGELVEYDEYIKDEHPWVKWVDGRNVAFDHSCDEFTDAAWMAVEYERRLQDLVDDPEVRNDAIAQLERGNDGNQVSKDAPIKLKEIWNKRDGKVYVWCERLTDQWLQDPKDWPLKVEGFPLVQLKFHDCDGKSCFQMAPVRPLFPLNQERNRLRTNAIQTSSRFVPKYAGPQDTFTGNGMKIFENRQAGSFVTTQAGRMPKLIDLPTSRADDRLLDAQAMDDFRLASGVSEQQAGVGSQADNPTATEVIARERFSGSRIDNLRGTYEEFYSKAVKKVFLIVQQNYPPARWIPIFNPGTREISDWTQFSQEWKEAEYGLIGIRPGSTAPPSKEGRQAKVLQIGNTLAQLIQSLAVAEQTYRQGGKVIDTSHLWKALLRPFDTEISQAEWERILPEIAGQDADQENMAMLAGGDAIVLDEDDDRVHLRIHTRFFSLYQTDEFEEGVDPEIRQRILQHIRDHQAAQLVENPESGALAGLTPQLQSGPAGPDATQFAQGMTTPGTLGGRANSLQAAAPDTNAPGANGPMLG